MTFGIAHPAGTVRRERNRSRRTAASPLAGILASLALAAAAWWFFAPPALGGATSFAVVDGTSMLPRLERGDLVVLRTAQRYRVGDVVAYRSHMLHRVVLHRIVAIHGGRYTFKGDNNTWLDPEQPSRADLVGKKWFAVPRAGRMSSALRTPTVAAALAVLLVLGFGLAGARRPEHAD